MATATLPSTAGIEQLLGDQAASLLEHRSETVSRTMLHLPGPDFIDRVWTGTDRSNRVLRNLSSIYAHGRLGGTGYVSLSPADQILCGTVKEAWNLGAAAVGATIYFGSDGAARQIVEISRTFHEAHELG